VPFVAEYVWQHAIKPGNSTMAESVHLATWPVIDPNRTDERLRTDMVVARQLVETGRAARKASNIRIRQPLQRVLISVGDKELPAEIIAQVTDELNVREVATLLRQMR